MRTAVEDEKNNMKKRNVILNEFATENEKSGQQWNVKTK